MQVNVLLFQHNLISQVCVKHFDCEDIPIFNKKKIYVHILQLVNCEKIEHL